MKEDMEQLTFREELSRGTMVFDGGMGTYFSASEKLPGLSRRGLENLRRTCHFLDNYRVFP